MIDIKENKKPKLGGSVKSFLNRKFDGLTINQFFDKIPVQEIMDILTIRNLVILQEDNTAWDGEAIGNKYQGKRLFKLAYKGSAVKDAMHNVYTPIGNAKLVLTWYRMPTKRYEVVVYVG